MSNATSKRNGYSRLQIALHWLIAALIFAAFFTHEGMGRVLNQRIETGATGLEGNTVHVWLGGLALALILFRLVVRFVSGAPGPLPETSPLMAAAVKWGHRCLYALMIAAPAVGAAAWYGHLAPAGEVHEVLGKLLMVLSVGHALAAILHQVLARDSTMARMLKPQG